MKWSCYLRAVTPEAMQLAHGCRNLGPSGIPECTSVTYKNVDVDTDGTKRDTFGVLNNVHCIYNTCRSCCKLSTYKQVRRKKKTDELQQRSLFRSAGWVIRRRRS